MRVQAESGMPRRSIRQELTATENSREAPAHPTLPVQITSAIERQLDYGAECKRLASGTLGHRVTAASPQDREEGRLQHPRVRIRRRVHRLFRLQRHASLPLRQDGAESQEADKEDLRAK